MRNSRCVMTPFSAAVFYLSVFTLLACLTAVDSFCSSEAPSNSSTGTGGSGESGGSQGSGGSGGPSSIPGCDGAGNCYVAFAASGRSNGSNWTNAFRGFGKASGQVDPSAMIRGVTYWIAAGNYGHVTFKTPNSNTSMIVIKGTTVAAHGPATDWNPSYAGPAVFGESTISTSYWDFEGQSRGSDWQSGYTLKFWNQNDNGGAAIFIGGNNNLTFDYVEIEGTGMTGGIFPNNSTADKCSTDNCGKWLDNGIYETTPVSNLYVGHSYIHHTGNTSFEMNVTGSGGSVNNNVTWEYDWISYNHTGQNGQHDQAYSLYASNVVIRYSVFHDISGSGLITTAGAGQPQLRNWDVYGNLFFWDSAYAAFNGRYWLATCDNAVLDFLGEAMSGHITFTNNTISGIYNSQMDTPGAAGSTMAISGLSGSGGSICGSGGCPKVTIENNLWYGDGYVYGGYSPYCQVVSHALCTLDYNTSYQGNLPSRSDWQTNSPTAPHDLNMSGTINPFVGSSASAIAGYGLITPDPFLSSPGVSLPPPYNFDMQGIARGINGTWDRGALQHN